MPFSVFCICLACRACTRDGLPILLFASTFWAGRTTESKAAGLPAHTPARLIGRGAVPLLSGAAAAAAAAVAVLRGGVALLIGQRVLRGCVRGCAWSL